MAYKIDSTVFLINYFVSTGKKSSTLKEIYDFESEFERALGYSVYVELDRDSINNLLYYNRDLFHMGKNTIVFNKKNFEKRNLEDFNSLMTSEAKEKFKDFFKKVKEKNEI